MDTIVISSQKGGSGKTTCAVHLAVAAAEAGRKVAIFDLDPQRSASGWAALRGEREPLTFAAEAGELAALLCEAARDYDLAVVDTPPRVDALAASVLRQATLILVPSQPTAFDLLALDPTLRLVQASGRPALGVLTRVPSRSPEAQDAAALAAERGLAIAPIQFAERRAYSRAIGAGLAVTEFRGGDAAAAEARALWRYIAAMLARQHTTSVA